MLSPHDSAYDPEKLLDVMWNDVLENITQEMEECDFRDTESDRLIGESDSEFVDVVEELTFDNDWDESSETNEASGPDLPDTTAVNKEKNPPEKQPLYPGSRVTVGAVMVILSLFTIKYDITGDALASLLKLLSILLPCGQILPSTLVQFKKFFGNSKRPLSFHYYCTFCFASLGENDKKCKNATCMRDLTSKETMSYFIEMPIVQQLQTFFARSGFHNDIQHRFQRKKKHPNNIEDIYDGRIYTKLFEDGILSSPDNISFVMNTDGVPVFKSSKMAIWPIYLIINELPYFKRMKSENMIFAGLWFSEKKPAMWTFLKPYVQTLKVLESGVEMHSPERGKFLCKGYVIACTCDLPARCLICNGMQYNGENGCWKCFQPGETVRIGIRGHCRAFPYQGHDPKGPLRTAAGVKQDAETAISKAQQGVARNAVNGVKGPSWLSVLEHFDMVRGIGIDYMHGVLLGVQKLLLTLWFNSKFSKFPFSISSKVKLIDTRLSQISPTKEIKRLPRSIEVHLKYWKASELRSFLLFYGLPTLYGILPDNYFSHYMLFVQAINFLLKDSISQSELQETETLLDNFCKSFSSLYQERFYTLNIHQLLHLVDDVRDLGQLHTHSCFTFEDKNGFILKLIHGTQSVNNQIISAVCLTQNLPELRSTCVPADSDIDLLYRELTRNPKSKFRTNIFPNIYIMSATYKRSLSPKELSALETYIGYSCPTDQFLAFNKIELTDSGSVICGLAYKRMYKRNYGAVKFLCNNISICNGVLLQKFRDAKWCDPLFRCWSSIIVCQSQFQIAY